MSAPSSPSGTALYTLNCARGVFAADLTARGSRARRAPPAPAHHGRAPVGALLPFLREIEHVERELRRRSAPREMRARRE